MQVTMSNILQLLEESFCTFSNEGIGCDVNSSIGSGSSYDVDYDDEDSSDEDIDTTKMLGMEILVKNTVLTSGGKNNRSWFKRKRQGSRTQVKMMLNKSISSMHSSSVDTASTGCDAAIDPPQKPIFVKKVRKGLLKKR